MAESSFTRQAQLGAALRGLFREAEAGRRDIEERWLRDLRQYKGVYDPEVAARLHPRRSKAFLRLTRAKVKAANARLMDVLFPGAGERNWSIAPTPVPEINPRHKGEIIARLLRETGAAPPAADKRPSSHPAGRKDILRMRARSLPSARSHPFPAGSSLRGERLSSSPRLRSS